MADIARWGKGRAYYAEDPAQVPQMFVEDTQNVSRATLIEEPFRPVEPRGSHRVLVPEDVVPADAVQFKETSTATGEGEDANDGDYDNAEKEESPDVAIIGGAVARIMFFVWGHRAISFGPLSLSERHRNTCVPRP
jgi:hypothetical protein